MIKLGESMVYLRNLLGITQRQAAIDLGMSYVHLCRIEHDQTRPSQEMQRKIKEAWGVDIYVFAWCRSPEIRKLPPAIRGAAYDLTAAWQKELDKKMRQRDAKQQRSR